MFQKKKIKLMAAAQEMLFLLAQVPKSILIEI